MSGISRKRFDGAFTNAAIDLQDEDLGAALTGASLDVGKLDALDGKADGRVTGQQAIDGLYDEINRLDSHTASLSSKQERGLWTALRGAAIAPTPISAGKGESLAAAAQQIVAEDKPGPGKLSHWALKGAAICENPALSSPKYAGVDAWKCNVFVGEAFHRAGLPFPINDEGRYIAANHLASQTRFFQTVANVDEVRAGDLIAVHRKRGSGHVEIVTDVQRGADGRTVSIASAGAHEPGSWEWATTGARLMKAARTNGQLGDDTYQLLRPMTAGGR